MSRLDPSARVRNHIIEILAEGPIRFEELSEALVGRGLALGPDPDERVDAVLDQMDEIEGLTIENPDDPDEMIGIIYDRIALLDGTTWTIPVKDLDLVSDTLSSDALGLAFVALINNWASIDGVEDVGLDMEGHRRAVAKELGVEADRDVGAGVVFPTGWLSGLGARAGGYVQLHFDGEAIHATPTQSAPEPTETMLKSLVEAMISGTEGYQSRSQAEVLTQLLTTHDELRSAVLPPLGEWFDAAGLTRRGPIVAPAGFDFDGEQLAYEIEDAIDLHGLKGRDAIRFAALVSTWHQWLSITDALGAAPAEAPEAARLSNASAGAPDGESLSMAALALDSIPVAAAFVDTAFDENKVEELVAFGEQLIDLTSGRNKAGPAWMVAQMLGAAGATDRFEDWIDAALSFDDEHLLSLFDKAWFEFDRSEWRKAKAIMNRLMMPPDNHDMMLIDSVLAPAGPTVGRNDPCPCGSGRKYKRCHLGLEEIPLADRLTLLYRKANRWLDIRHRREVHLSALVRAGASDISAARLLETDPLIPDAVLSEDARFDDWLAERGPLLPSDEAMLAAQWALVERSVFEVTEVRLDQGLTLRDTRTGDVVEVAERLGTHGMRTGTYILVRPLPVGDDTLQFFGGITFIPDSMLQAFIDLLDSEPSAIQLLSLVAKAEAPPELRNTSGESLVVSEMIWQVDDEAVTRQALDGTFEPDGVSTGVDASDNDTIDFTMIDVSIADFERWSWLAEPDDHDESEPINGRTVLGSIALANGQLTFSTNSAERAEQAVAMITRLLPEAVLLEHLQSTLDDLREDKAYEDYIFNDHDTDAYEGEGEREAEGDSDGGHYTGSEDGHASRKGHASTGLLDPSEIPPEVQAVLRQQMDLHEQRWVDESIPALGGATPREALDDPTRRDDLFRLLNRMEEMESRIPMDQAGLGMRTSRLRELLGL